MIITVKILQGLGNGENTGHILGYHKAKTQLKTKMTFGLRVAPEGIPCYFKPFNRFLSATVVLSQLANIANTHQITFE